MRVIGVVEDEVYRALADALGFEGRWVARDLTVPHLMFPGSDRTIIVVPREAVGIAEQQFKACTANSVDAERLLASWTAQPQGLMIDDTDECEACQ